MQISKIVVQGFKPFEEKTEIPLSNLNIFFGANSCGKSSLIQSLLLIKQTLSSRVDQIDILVNGKYINLGQASDVINKNSDNQFSLGIGIAPFQNDHEFDEKASDKFYTWNFKKNNTKINDLSLEKCELNAHEVNYVIEKSPKDDHYYDGKIHIEMKKMLPFKVMYKYDSRYTNLINGLLYELLKLSEENKNYVWSLDADFLKTQRKIIDSFMNVINSSSKKLDELKIEDLSDARQVECYELTKELFAFLKSIMEKLELQHQKNSLFQLDFIFSTYFTALIRLEDENYFKIKDVFNDFKSQFEGISTSQDEKTILLREYNIEAYRGDYDPYLYNLVEFNKNIDKVFKNMQYLGPIRERPRNIYEFDVDENPLYVGKFGQYLPGVLAYNAKRKINVILPGEEEAGEYEFSTALNSWLKHLEIADSVVVEMNNVVSVNIVREGVRSNISNVGVGVSQVLPVLVMGLLSSNHQVLLYEQPELHLHPLIQSRLIDFFISLSKAGRQIIIESHSEYFLHRLRYQITSEYINKDSVNILFFENQEFGANVYKAELGDFGDFSYPKGFKDTSEGLLKDLLGIQLEKMSNE